MKKNYVKPMIIIEDFRLCENIALGCDVKANQYKDACAYYDEDLEMFLFSITIDTCNEKVQDSEDLCYHNFDNISIFTS